MSLTTRIMVAALLAWSGCWFLLIAVDAVFSWRARSKGIRHDLACKRRVKKRQEL
jgi:hypothetical protein